MGTVNRTSTLVGWAPRTWNPITGCLHWKTGVCAVGEGCYAKLRAETRLRGRFGYPADDPFEPTFHEDRLKLPGKVRKPTTIFVCSMGDILGEWVPAEWVESVIGVIEENRRHTFMILTKNPARFDDFDFPQNCLLGTTINTVKDLKRIDYLMKVPNRRFLSIEPLFEDISEELSLNGIDWVIMGGKTNRVGKVVFSPPAEWVVPVVQQARALDIPVYIKDNLTTYERIQEFPFWWRSCKQCAYGDAGSSSCERSKDIDAIIPGRYQRDFWEGRLVVACPCFERC